MTVELVYSRDCPNVAEARANLIRALAAAGEQPRWTEWDSMAAESPAHVRVHGSPTILVDGKDVAGGDGSGGSGGAACCRLYANGGGRFAGAPSVEQIAAALRGGADWKGSMAAAPGIAFAFLPKLACPACWPAYAGLMSAVGLGFLLDAAWLLPLTAAFLALSVGALAFRARQRRGRAPFVLGLAAAMAVLSGKFVFESESALYGGIAALVAASVWNGWPVRGGKAACPACIPQSFAGVGSTRSTES